MWLTGRLGSCLRPLRARACGGAVVGLLAVGCGSAMDPPDGPGAPWPTPTCPAEVPSLPDTPANFTACSTGSGSFGRWTLDAAGLPAYDYLLDQWADTRARFPNTEDLDRRDHWHQLGNDRVNAIFTNDGYVQVLTQDRGPSWLNFYDEDRQNYGGGFSYLDDGTETWTTAYKYRPPRADVRRRFGLGYAESMTEYRGIRLTRRLHAPPGDFPGVIDEVTLENRGDERRRLRHYEYWDVGRLQLRGNWLVSGMLDRNIPDRVREARQALNAMFDEAPRWDPDRRRVSVERQPSPTGGGMLPAADAVSDLDARPGDPFLQALVGNVEGVYVDQARFFGQGGIAAPDTVTGRLDGGLVGPRSGDGQTLALVLRSDVELGPGEHATLRFVYGYKPMGEAEPQPAIDPGWAHVDPAAGLAEQDTAGLGRRLLYLAMPTVPFLQRELAWHSAQLLQSVGWREYWGRHVVPQGSAYLYLHGVDGAPRDQLLFALPLTYLRPALAREALQLCMGLVHRDDRRMSYAFHGHGMLDDAYIHYAPSDLYIFFLLAMTEYLAATGDTTILDEAVEAHPRGAGPAESGFTHVKNGVRHLFDTIGTGEHGLLRIGTGDWSDGIVLLAKDRDLAVKKGESVPNTQMAAWVLPLAARWVRPRDAALADEMERRAGELRQAAAAAWAGDHYLRAYFGDGAPYGADSISLESQVWPLIAGIPDAGQRASLVAAIAARLESRSPIGAFIAEPPADQPDAGQVWPAITGLLTWGYAHGRPAGAPLADADPALTSLRRMTLFAHAEAFPDMWAGIWSGADGSYGPSGGPAPGATWQSEVTPMTDHPVQNNNLHAMALLAALRTVGVEPNPDGSGLRITPPLPADASHRYTLDTPLLRVVAAPGRITVTYRELGSSGQTIEVALGHKVASATRDGKPVTVMPDDTSVRFTFPTSIGSAAELVVTY